MDGWMDGWTDMGAGVACAMRMYHVSVCCLYLEHGWLVILNADTFAALHQEFLVSIKT